MPPKCENKDCKTTACFNFKGEPKGRFCKTHILDITMVNVVDKLCNFPDCEKRAIFGLVEGKTAKPVMCIKHKTDGMINVKGKRCYETGCFNIPIYNFEGEKLGKWCILHKPENCLNVVSPKCVYEGCKTSAHFNFPGETVGIYCSKHFQTGMNDIKHNRCDYNGEEGCNKSPSFKFENERQCRRCKEHIILGMINGKHRKCVDEGCNKVPSFGNKGGFNHFDDSEIT